MQSNKWKVRKNVLALTIVFFVPFLIAWYMFFHTDHSSLQFSNKGELIRMPFQISSLDLQDYQDKPIENKEQKWSILYWTKNCDNNCIQVLDKIMRVRLVLGKDMKRTQAWLATPARLNKSMQTQLEDINGLNIKPILMPETQNAQELLEAGNKHILLVDPNGNVFMRYDASAPHKAIHSDLKRLLKVSKIG